MLEILLLSAVELVFPKWFLNINKIAFISVGFG